MSPVAPIPSTTQAPDLPGPRAIVDENFELLQLDSSESISVIQRFLTTESVVGLGYVSTGARCTGATKTRHGTASSAPTIQNTDKTVAPVQLQSTQPIRHSNADTTLALSESDQFPGPVAPVQRGTSGWGVFLNARPVDQRSVPSRSITLHRCNARVSGMRLPAWLVRNRRLSARTQCRLVAPVQHRFPRGHGTLIDLSSSEVMANAATAHALHRCNVTRIEEWPINLSGKKGKGLTRSAPFLFMLPIHTGESS